MRTGSPELTVNHQSSSIVPFCAPLSVTCWRSWRAGTAVPSIFRSTTPSILAFVLAVLGPGTAVFVPAHDQVRLWARLGSPGSTVATDGQLKLARFWIFTAPKSHDWKFRSADRSRALAPGQKSYSSQWATL